MAGASAPARGSRRGPGNRSFDAKQNPFQPFVAQHVTGADATDRDAALCKPCLTTLVVPRRRGSIVYEPVHLDCQTGRRTIEIEDVRSDRVLPAKA